MKKKYVLNFKDTHENHLHTESLQLVQGYGLVKFECTSIFIINSLHL